MTQGCFICLVSFHNFISHFSSLSFSFHFWLLHWGLQWSWEGRRYHDHLSIWKKWQHEKSAIMFFLFFNEPFFGDSFARLWRLFLLKHRHEKGVAVSVKVILTIWQIVCHFPNQNMYLATSIRVRPRLSIVCKSISGTPIWQTVELEKATISLICSKNNHYWYDHHLPHHPDENVSLPDAWPLHLPSYPHQPHHHTHHHNHHYHPHLLMRMLIYQMPDHFKSSSANSCHHWRDPVFLVPVIIIITNFIIIVIITRWLGMRIVKLTWGGFTNQSTLNNLFIIWNSKEIKNGNSHN